MRGIAGGQKPSSRESLWAWACLSSFIVCRQARIEIDFDATGQRLEALHEAGVNSLQALWMAGDVAGKEAEELAKHRVVFLGGLGARQYDLAARADGVVDLVALARPKGTAHGFRHRGLVAVGQRGFDFEGGSHGALRSKGVDTPYGNAIALSCQCKCIACDCCHPARGLGWRMATS